MRASQARPRLGTGALAAVARAAVALAVAATAAPLAMAPAASAMTLDPGFTANTFVFGGALSGTLHLVPKTGCDGAGPAGVTLSLSGPLQGSRSTTWVVQVVSLQNGNYQLRPGQVVGATVSDGTGRQQWGLDDRGDLTVSGASGDIKAQVASAGGTVLHVTGAWACPAA